jgi:hypothetical protein
MSETPADRDRIELLAARVRWLDRYRRKISIVVMLLAAPISERLMSHALGADWPEIHTALLSLIIAVVVWWVVEVGTAGIAAVWETECDQLIRDRGLPRAQLLSHRKR